MNWNNFSIRTKLLVICFSLSIIPIIIAGFIIYGNVSKSMTNEIMEKLNSQVLTYKDLVEQSFNQVKSQKESANKQAEAVIRAHSSEVMNAVNSGYNLNVQLAKILVGETGYVFILDYNGNYLLSKNNERNGENILNSQDASGTYFVKNIIEHGKKLNKGEIVFEKYFWKNKEDVMPREKIAGIINLPDQKRVIGISTYIDEIVDLKFENKLMADLNKKIKEVKVGKTGYMYVINSQGLCIVHPSLEGQNVYKYDFIKKIIEKKNGYMIYKWEGRNKITAYSYYEPKDWIIVSGSYFSDFNESIISIRNIIFIICLLIMIVGGVTAYFFANAISSPLSTITKNAAKFSVGDISFDVNDEKILKDYCKRNDEIGEICRAFSKLIHYLKDKVKVAKEIAEGNLLANVTLASEIDELGKALLFTVNSLNFMISNINSSVGIVNASALQVSGTSEQLSQGAAEQASSLEQISSAITEINSQSKKNAEYSKKTNLLAKESKEYAEVGNVLINELVGSIGKINKSSDDIKLIVKIIDDIAFQTNLLSLNANVEASRAGKYGKGFSIVAEEVRNLAGRSAMAVKDTTEKVEESIKNILESNGIVQKTAKHLFKIAEKAGEVVNVTEEISMSNKEQSIALEQINLGLNQIEQVTQLNTASSEEAASSAEELASQSEVLKTLVEKFKLKKENNNMAVFEKNQKLNNIMQIAQ